MRGRGTRRVEWGRPEFKEENEIMEVVKTPTIYTPGLNRDYWHEGILIKIISNHSNLSRVLVPPIFFSLYFHKSLLTYALRKLNAYSERSAFLFPVKDLRILSLQSRKPS